MTPSSAHTDYIKGADMNQEYGREHDSSSARPLWSRFVRKLLALTQDSDPTAKVESGWKVYNGEGRGIAAGNEWITNIDVPQLLQSRKMHASMQATLDVDRDSSVSYEQRSQAIVRRYQELLDSSAPLEASGSTNPTEQHAQG